MNTTRPVKSHPGDRRSRLIARQGSRRRLDRRAARGARLQGRAPEVRPYINVDPGTMSPYQHGEVYVTDDGAETDLDLGHYERFTNQTTTAEQQLDDREDLPVGDPEGAARRLPRADRPGHPAHHQRDQGQHPGDRDDADIVIVEIGGTVGDIESQPFLEAIRQLRQDVGRENTLYIHLTLVPFIGAAGELKTKPTQHSVRDLRAIGIQPDILLCRTDRFLDQDIKRKIALFCDVDEEAVITAKDVSSIYEVPLVLGAEGLDPDPAAAPQSAADRGADGRLGRSGGSDQASHRRGHDPRGRQVRRLRGLLQEPERSALSRRLQAPAAREHPLGRGRGARTAGGEQLLDGAGRDPRAGRLRRPRHARA